MAHLRCAQRALPLLAAAALGASLCDAPTAAASQAQPLAHPLGRSLDHHVLHGALKGPRRLERYSLALTAETPPRLIAEARFGDQACGHPRFLHGGAIALLFDDAMGALFLSLGKGTGFTANLSVDYRAPVPHGTELRVTAAVARTEVSQRSGALKVYLTARLEGAAAARAGGEPQLYAEATALFVVKPPSVGMLLGRG